jgi:tetratricopeptide (TPR) repeat protein
MAIDDNAAARIECEKGLAIAPDCVGCGDRLASLEWRAGDKTRATAIRERIAFSNPSNVDAWFAYGGTAGHAEQYDLAVDCFRRVINMDELSARQRASALHNLALYLGIQARNGEPEKFEQALQMLEESERADPSWKGNKREKMYRELRRGVEWHNAER